VDYGAFANLMNKRPFSNRDAYAFLRLNDTLSNHPAILYNKHSKGRVIYFAFSPEFFVALAYDTAGHCPINAGDAIDFRYGIPEGGASATGGDPAAGIQPADHGHWYDVDDPFVTNLYELMKDALQLMKTP